MASTEALDRAVALARELLHRSGALSVSVMVDRGEHGPPVVVECARLEPVRITEGEHTRELPHDWGVGVELPELPEVRQLPPMEVDAAEGTVASIFGGLDMLGRAIRDVAGLMGGHSVVAAQFETTDPQAPLGLAARAGEPLVVLLGDEEYELAL